MSASAMPAQFDNDEFLETHLPGRSAANAALRRRIRELNSPRVDSLVRVVLIRGESGAGKTYLADILAAHREWMVTRNTGASLAAESPLSTFHESKYQKILIPSFPDTLIESELFGYEAGAFTDAKTAKPGLLGGKNAPEYRDILLDEIADASRPMQAKLLTLLDTGEFRPVGGREFRRTEARLLLATNRDLESMIRAGDFREDLFWRMSQLTIDVPPLRNQREDIPDIARHIEASLRRDIEEAPGVLERTLSEAEIEWAQHHHWPGNVRELRDAIRIHVFENGARTLAEIVTQMEARMHAGTRRAVISRQVSVRLGAVLKGEQDAPASLDDLLKEFAADVRQALVDWYDATEPTPEVLQRLFPGVKPSSVRSKISEWRGA